MSVLERAHLPRPRLDSCATHLRHRLLAPGDLVALINAYPWHYQFVCGKVGVPMTNHPPNGVADSAPRLVVVQARMLPGGCTCSAGSGPGHWAGCPGLFREFAGHPQVVQVSPLRLPGRLTWLTAAWLRYCPEP